jgi:phosphatidylserine decarboxylase
MTQSSNPKQPPKKAHIEGTKSNLLTLNEAGPIQMGFWVRDRVWATANFLIPLRNSITAKKKDGTLAPMRQEIQDFKAWVTAHSVYRMRVVAMIDQSNGYVLTLDDATKVGIIGVRVKLIVWTNLLINKAFGNTLKIL